MKKRAISLVLALLLLVTVLPAKASAAAEVSEIRTQITSMYRKILSKTGLSSLHGSCGFMTSWQMYLLGIDKTLSPRDGRDQYNAYCNLDTTTGGYRVRPYSAAEFTLEEALNSITRNGTRDAYNLLVGFQRTNTEAGAKYGHSLFIHAIIDGTVYFVEGFDVSIGSRLFYEGRPIEVSIADFCSYYGKWTVFEGVINFGLRDYADFCQVYSSNIYVQMTSPAVMFSDPATETGEYQDPVAIRTVAVGERLHVTGVYENPEQELYYQVLEDGVVGYIPAEAAAFLTACYDDVTARNIQAPGLLKKGQGFSLKGELCSEQNVIDTVLVEVYAQGEDIPVLALETVEGTRSYSLNNRALSQAIAFRTLAEGTYEFRISVDVVNHYVEDGRLQTQWATLPLWSSTFQVGGETEGCRVVTFDPCGGTGTVNQMVLGPGDTAASLPAAQRSGYTFAGWYTQSEGGIPVAGAADADVVYAHWEPRTDGYTGWDMVDGDWRYYEDGSIQTGWLTSDGICYYLTACGSPTVGWSWIDGKMRYFSGSGALWTGWMETLEGRKYYLFSDGSVAMGWTEIDGKRYYFDENGWMQTGWFNQGSETYYLYDNGTMAVGWIIIQDTLYHFDENGCRLPRTWSGYPVANVD